MGRRWEEKGDDNPKLRRKSQLTKEREEQLSKLTMGVIQKIADLTVGTLGEVTSLDGMPCLSTGKATFEDPVKVRIGRDQLDPPMEGVTREPYSRARSEERGRREELDVVMTSKTHCGVKTKEEVSSAYKGQGG